MVHTKQKFIKNGIEASKLFIVPGLTPKIVSYQSNEIGKYVSFIGRASEEKGIVEFLEVAKVLPNIQFAVVGSLDPSLHSLKDNTPDNVLWSGFLSGKDYDKFYQQSKIVVVPSKWYEGFPNVITRAMQHGKPVITSNIGAMHSIIDHNTNGMLVAPGDVEQLKNTIEDLYRDDNKCIRLGAQGKKKALQDYNDMEIYKYLINTYTYALNTKK